MTSRRNFLKTAGAVTAGVAAAATASTATAAVKHVQWPGTTKARTKCPPR